MKTTIDLPDEYLHRAKITAAQRRTTVKELVIQGLILTIEATPVSEEAKRMERAGKLLAALQGRNNESVGRLRRDKLHERTR